MATFRAQNNVPDVYTRKSRDFQLFCNLYDCVNGGVKYDIDSILDVVDTDYCNERLIPYLQTKLGFWTENKLTAEQVRMVLKGFITAVRNKGSIKGVEFAIQIFLKIKRIKTNVNIRVINEPENESDEPYTVLIGTEEALGDTTILDDILWYILPAGYSYRYVYYADMLNDSILEHRDEVRIVTGNQQLLGGLREMRDTYPETWEPYMVNNIDQTVIANVNRVDAERKESTDILNKYSKINLWDK